MVSPMPPAQHATLNPVGPALPNSLASLPCSDNSCPACRYDERLLDLQQQRDELQRERADLMRKLEALHHASGGLIWVGSLGTLCRRLLTSTWLHTWRAPAAHQRRRGDTREERVNRHAHQFACIPHVEEERLRLREQYESRIKLLDEKVKAVRAKVGGWESHCCLVKCRDTCRCIVPPA